MSPAAAEFARPISPPPPHNSQNPTPVFPTSSGSNFADKEPSSGLGFDFSNKGSKPPRIRQSVKKTRGKVSVSNVLHTSLNLNLNLGDSSRDDQYSKSVGSTENVGFAFGTSNSGSNGNKGFVFAARNDSSHLNVCGGGIASGYNMCSSSAWNSNHKSSSSEFVDDKISLGGNSCSECCAGKSPSMKEERDFVFGGTDTNSSTLKPGFNNGGFLRRDESSSTTSVNVRCTKSSTTTEYSKADETNTFGSAGFVFGANSDKLASDFGLGKKSSTDDSCAKSGGNDSDAPSDAREFLPGNGHSSFTTSEGTERDVGGRKDHPFGATKDDSKDHSGFSFGATKDDSVSQLGKNRSRKYRRNSNFVSQGGKRTPAINDFKKPSTEKKPSSTESSDLHDEKKNLGASKTEFGSASVKWSADAMKSSSYKFVTGSSSSSGSAFYKVPLSKLVDDMKGLNIDSAKGISNIDKAEFVGNISSFCTDGDFSFKARGKASGPAYGKENQTFYSAENISTRGVLNEHPTSQDNTTNRTSTTYAFSSAASSHVPQNVFGCEASTATAVKNKGNPVFATPPATADAGSRDFKMESFSFGSNLFPESSGKFEFCASSRGMTDKWLKKTRGKSRQRVQTKPLNEQDQIPKEGNSPKTSKSPGCYSPMDFSPYGNATENVPRSTGTSIATEKKEENSLDGKQSSGNNKSCEKPEEQGGISSKIQQESESKPSEQNGLSAIREQYKKKYKLKVGNGLSAKTPAPESLVSSAQFSSNGQNSFRGGEPRVQKGSTSNLQWKSEGEYSKQNSCEDSSHEECEQWRMRGNQAYKNRDLSKAEECYTNGINSVREKNVQGLYSRPLLLCYTNRAATRMSLRRFREALADCKFVASVDPGFLKAKLRAANCHLLLGEFQEAIQYYNYCFEPSAALLDRKIVIEASEGVQKAQQVSALCQSDNTMQQTTSDAASSALEKTDKGLSISCYSERLLEMRGQSLFLLRRYDEVIELCERTLPIAENNFECKNSARQWRWFLMSKCQFHLGRLEVAFDLIERLQNMASANDWSSTHKQESFSPLAATVRELLHRKKSGNEAFQSGKHSEAVEHYTAAIFSSLDSRPFAAICFCNRAAAHQALGLVADAIADCSVAIALDGDYVKAVSRRATLHELIRDYKQAISDLQKIISLLEIQSQKCAQQSGKQEGLSASDAKELKRAQRRLALMEEKTKQEAPMDFYLILGIKASDSEADIKKAYKRAALKHHPDKACQYLARTDSGDDGKSWKDIVDKVHEDAERLFKMIGEAYTVLSDADKRSKYNLGEEIRNNHSDSKRRPDSGRSSDYDNSPYEKGYYSRRQQNYGSWTYERSRNRRYWQDSWRSYDDSEDRW